MNRSGVTDSQIPNAGVVTGRAIAAALIMALAAALSWILTPTDRLADKNPINLESMIPAAFGDWQIDSKAFAVVVNPQQTELISRLYSQTLSRTYVNTRTGARIMLSIAYGEDQRDNMQMHYPEVCYPAQGFEVTSNRIGEMPSAGATLPVRRLETVLNHSRFEPVTYWTMLGESPLTGGMSKKMAEMRYGLRGQIVDGLLFRVSSIDRDSAAAFSAHERFVGDLLASLPPADRHRLTGS